MSDFINEMAAAVQVPADLLGISAPGDLAEVPAITMQDIEAIALPGDLPAEAPAPREFRIADDGVADWALQKIAEERREFGRIEELGNSQIAAIQAKIGSARHRCESNTAFLIGHLGRYFDTVEHRKTKTQESYRLLSGTLILKLGKVKTAQDDEKLVTWLKANGYTDYIKQTEAPKWGELKEKLNLEPGIPPTMVDTGEIVDGVTVEQNPATFDVKV